MKCEKYDTLTLLGYVAGDLSERTQSEVELHLRDCDRCAAVVADVRKEQAAFLDAYPSINGQRMPVRSRLIRFPALRTALALAAGLILAVGTGTMLVHPPGDDYRSKGGAALKLFVLDGSGVPVESASPVCAPGARIQFTYSCGSERCFVLMSVDTSGSVSVFYPDRGDSSVTLEPGNDLPLPNSIVLDGYLGTEWYVAVFSAHPLPVAAVAEKVRRAFRKKEENRFFAPNIENASVRSILLTKKEMAR